MRILIIFTLFTFTLAQNEQLMMTRAKVITSDALRLKIISVNITNEENPLKIESDKIKNDNDVKFLDIPSSYDKSHPMIIEVFHPLILTKFKNLREASLVRCGMRRIAQSSFENCEHLEYLSLHYNLIEEIPARVFRSCRNLKLLAIPNNKIKKIESGSFDGLKRLSLLALDDNQLTAITTGLFTQTTAYGIGLTFNPIQIIEPGAFNRNLVLLNLRNCKIKELNPEIIQNLTKLESLNLSNNPITQLPPGIFENLTRLRRIDLEHTKIKRLNSNSFGILEKLEEFSIIASEVVEIEPEFLGNFPSLETFKVLNNSCVNANFRQIKLNNFDNSVLSQCYANWIKPRERMTEQPTESDFFSNLKSKIVNVFSG